MPLYKFLFAFSVYVLVNINYCIYGMLLPTYFITDDLTSLTVLQAMETLLWFLACTVVYVTTSIPMRGPDFFCLIC